MSSTPYADRARVATFNVLSPHLAAWPRRQEVLRNIIGKLDVDIIALQEINAAADRDRDLEQLLGSGWHVAWHSHTTTDGVGLALASRWPLGKITERGLGVTERAAAHPWSAVVITEVLAPPPLGIVYVAHHKPVYQFGYERERELQAVAAAGFIKSEAPNKGEHTLVLGDFDATPDSASLRFWTGRQSLEGVSVSYHDPWDTLCSDDPGHTFTPENPLVAHGDMRTAGGRRINYILVGANEFGPTLQPISINRIGVNPVQGIQASDHYGVVAELAVPPRGPAD